MINNQLWYNQDINKPVVPRQLTGRLFKGDANGNRVGVRLFDGNEQATVDSGTVCMGKYLRADGYAQAVTGTVSGNELYFDLPDAAYEIEGKIGIFISANLSGNKVTWLALSGTIDRTDNDAWIDPEHVVPDTVEDLIAEIDAMRSATSAAEAVVAGSEEEISNIKNAFGAVTGNTIINFSDPSKGYYIPNNVSVGSTVNVNNIATATTYSYALVECSEGDIFNITGSAGNAARLYSFLDANYKLLVKADANSTFDGVEITAPAQSAYLLINTETHNSACFRNEKIIDKVNANSGNINSIKNYLYVPAKLTQEYFKSLSANGYLLTSGTTSPSPDWHTSDYIEYDLAIPISYSIIGHYRVASLMFFDESKGILGYVNASGTQQNVKIAGSASIPDGTKYFRYSVRIDDDYSSAEDYIEYYESRISQLIDATQQVLTGKKWNVLGDSITANPAYADKRYFERISERQGGMTTRNYGIGGTRIGGTDSNAFCTRYASMDDDAEIVTVYGGVNDYGQDNPTPLGAYGDSTNATFYGALKILLEGLITKYPYALIVFCTPIQPNYSSWSVGLEANSQGFTIYDYADAIIKMCGRYGVPVVDLCRMCGFTSRIAAEKTKYFYDGLHLNDNGHSKISYLIENSMILNAKGKII